MGERFLLDGHYYQYDLGWIIKQILEQKEIVNGLPEYIKELIKEGLDALGIESIIYDLIAKYSYAINVVAPPDGLTPATPDGTTDSTKAIQGCLDYAKRQGVSIVFFPYGKYLTGSLNVPDGVALAGFDASATTLFLKQGASKALITLNGNGGIHDLTLDANASNQVTSQPAIAGTCKDFEITNTILKGCTDGASLAVTGGLRIDDVVVSGFTDIGLHLSGGRVIADNLVFSGFKTANVVDVLDLGNNNCDITATVHGTASELFNVWGNNNHLVFKTDVAMDYQNTGEHNTILIDYPSTSKRVVENVIDEVSGDRTETSGSKSETVTGDSTSNISGNVTENVTNAVTKNYGSLDLTLGAESFPVHTPTKTWDLLHPERFSLPDVRYYGAVGDGETTDTEAFRKSLEAQGCAIVPAGTFKVRITLTDGQAVYGLGEESVLVGISGQHVISASQAYGCTISGLKIVGTKNQNGVHMDKCNGFFLQNLYVRECDKGIRVAGKTGNYGRLTHIENCYCYLNQTQGLYVSDYADIHLINVECVSNGQKAQNSSMNCLIENGSFKMLNCHFWNQNDYYGFNRPQVSFKAFNCGAFEITNCHIEGAYETCLVLDQCSSGTIVNSFIYATFGAYSISLNSSNISFIGCAFGGQAGDDVSYKPEFKAVFFQATYKSRCSLIGCQIFAKLVTGETSFWTIIGGTYSVNEDLVKVTGPYNNVQIVNANGAYQMTGFANWSGIGGSQVRQSGFSWTNSNLELTGDWYSGLRHTVINASSSPVTVTATQPSGTKKTFTLPGGSVKDFVCYDTGIYMIS